MTTQTKTCTKCKETKLVSEFHRDKHTTDGYSVYCRMCGRKKIKEYVENLKNDPIKYQQRLTKAYRRRRDRMHNDPAFRNGSNIRTRINMALKHHIKSQKTYELLGCTVEELKQYLESKFTNGMSWDNYGKGGWHVDHIVPCSAFDLSDPVEQKQCFHYTNLQPLWEIENLLKSDKWVV